MMIVFSNYSRGNTHACRIRKLIKLLAFLEFSLNSLCLRRFVEYSVMATAVEVPSSLMIMSDPCYEEARSKLKLQNHYLAYHITKRLLRDANLNGLQRLADSRFTHEVINQPGFKETVAALEKACQSLRDTNEEEMNALVSTLDITDSQLCANYHRVSEHMMSEEIRFGRIASLFFFTYVLSKRLHGEGRQKETQSLVDWLTAFLNERIAPWLVQNHKGDWVS